MIHFFSSFFALLLTTLALQHVCMSQKPVMTWDFETVKNRSAIEESPGIADTIEGNFELMEVVTGKGLHLDGFTSRIIRNAKDIKKPVESSRNWSLMNRLNQKGTRPQDKPIDIRQLNADEQEIIKLRYPELF